MEQKPESIKVKQHLGLALKLGEHIKQYLYFTFNPKEQ